jgi:hypothetical protein
MTRLHTLLVKSAATVAVAAGMVAATASPASSYVVCDRWGHCWHTYRPYAYSYPAPYYGSAYYGPYYDPYYDPYYYPYHGPYYGGPAVSFGFSFGGDGHYHGHH